MTSDFLKESFEFRAFSEILQAEPFTTVLTLLRCRSLVAALLCAVHRPSEGAELYYFLIAAHTAQWFLKRGKDHPFRPSASWPGRRRLSFVANSLADWMKVAPTLGGRGDKVGAVALVGKSTDN